MKGRMYLMLSFLILTISATAQKSTKANGNTYKNKGQQNNNTGAGTQNIYNKTIVANTVKEITLVSPEKIVIPANSSRDVPIVITNNRSYPIFEVVLEIKVTEGPINVGQDCLLLPLSSGYLGAKFSTFQIQKINANSSYDCFIQVNGSKYDKPTKLSLTITTFLKEPAPNFSQDSMKDLPKTLEVPEDLVPKVYKNK